MARKRQLSDALLHFKKLPTCNTARPTLVASPFEAYGSLKPDSAADGHPGSRERSQLFPKRRSEQVHRRRPLPLSSMVETAGPSSRAIKHSARRERLAEPKAIRHPSWGHILQGHSYSPNLLAPTVRCPASLRSAPPRQQRRPTRRAFRNGPVHLPDILDGGSSRPFRKKRPLDLFHSAESCLSDRSVIAIHCLRQRPRISYPISHGTWRSSSAACRSN